MTVEKADPGFRPNWSASFVGRHSVRFRTWAPGVSSLAVRTGSRDLPMTRDPNGWFERVCDTITPGAAYSFVLPDGRTLPDPASRAQAGDVHGSSIICDPGEYVWKTAGWSGRPWEVAVLYELHIGAFTPEGTFRSAAAKLAHLADLGITAVEIMPVAQFSGNRGWGYDGVLLYAPHNAYGTPDDFKAFIDQAHRLGLMVLLDVVYNHFGPDGNYLPTFAPAFFDAERHTPWGAAIAYEKQPVRDFFIDNALYWLDEFRLDGLRLDAIDHVRDTRSQPEILVEIAQRVRTSFPGRHIHLTTEDNRNVTHLHARDDKGVAPLFDGEWNDDFHNAAHVLVTGETDGYYEDFAENPAAKLTRALAEGFVYQGEPSPHADGAPRGEPSHHLPPTAFVDFLQNHDQIGNRALGERLSVLAEGQKLRVLTTMLLLSPHIPLLFMGDEWGATQPFLFFADFHGDLADAVRKGRRREFAKFAAFRSEANQRQIPDPNAASTFAASKLDWKEAETSGAEHLAFTRSLLHLRSRFIVPLLRRARGNAGKILETPIGGVAVEWTLDGGRLQMRANLTNHQAELPPIDGETIFSWPPAASEPIRNGTLPANSIVVAVARDDLP